MRLREDVKDVDFVGMPGTDGIMRGWRLTSYLVLGVLFWTLLGVAGGGEDGVHIEWTGLAINVVLFGAVWRGAAWALILLFLEALFLTGFIASVGVPPWGPWFGALALLSGAQALLLMGLIPGFAKEHIWRSTRREG